MFGNDEDRQITVLCGNELKTRFDKKIVELNLSPAKLVEKLLNDSEKLENIQLGKADENIGTTESTTSKTEGDSDGRCEPPTRSAEISNILSEEYTNAMPSAKSREKEELELIKQIKKAIQLLMQHNEQTRRRGDLIYVCEETILEVMDKVCANKSVSEWLTIRNLIRIEINDKKRFPSVNNHNLKYDLTYHLGTKIKSNHFRLLLQQKFSSFFE